MDIIYGDLIYIDSHSRVTGYRCAPVFKKALLIRANFIPQPSTFFRKKVTETHQLNNEYMFSMDYDFWLRLSKTYTFHRLNTALACFRMHGRSKGPMLGLDLLFQENEKIRHSNPFLAGKKMNAIAAKTILGACKLKSWLKNLFLSKGLPPSLGGN